MLLPLLCLPALVAGLPGLATSQDSTHHLPLVRRTIHRRDGFVDLDRMATYADSIRYKYGLKSADELGRRQISPGFGMIDQGGDGSYLATLGFGTPPQYLDVVLDTGSSDLWVASTQCVDCPADTPEFNTTRSSTVTVTSRSVDFFYGSGDASGTLVRDYIGLGPFIIPSQTFAGVTRADGVLDGSTAGIFGLGFQSISVSGATPLWQYLINHGVLRSPEMSFYFTRYKDIAVSPTETNPGGTFTLGGTNSGLFKGAIEFHAFPVGTVPGFWLQTVSAITVNGHSVNIANDPDNHAAIDTGTTLIGGPTAAVAAFWDQIDGSIELTGRSAGYYVFPCGTAIHATLAFGGTAWPISADDINYGHVDPDYCIGSVFDITRGGVPDPGSPSWVVGDAFLKNVYTVFRAGANPAVGFAQLADGLNV